MVGSKMQRQARRGLLVACLWWWARRRRAEVVGYSQKMSGSSRTSTLLEQSRFYWGSVARSGQEAIAQQQFRGGRGRRLKVCTRICTPRRLLGGFFGCPLSMLIVSVGGEKRVADSMSYVQDKDKVAQMCGEIEYE